MRITMNPDISHNHSQVAKTVDTRIARKDITEETRKLLRNCTNIQEMHRNQIASCLCLSERTFGRRLKSRDIKFENLVTQEIKHRVLTMMLEGVVSSQEITEKLGYSGTTYFYQWFKKNIGLTFKESKLLLTQNQSAFVSLFASSRGTSENQFSITLSGQKKPDNWQQPHSTIRDLSIEEIEKVTQ